MGFVSALLTGNGHNAIICKFPHHSLHFILDNVVTESIDDVLVNWMFKNILEFAGQI